MTPTRTHATRAFTLFISVSAIVLITTTLDMAAIQSSDSIGCCASVYASAIQSDGKIIAAGGVVLRGPYDTAFRLVRYNQDGSLDATFGSEGRITTNFSEVFDQALAVAIQSDGKIVAAGAAGVIPGPQGQTFALVRYNRDGSLDTDFGTGGKVITDLPGPWETASAVAIQSDGRIIAAGAARTGDLPSSGDFALVRYNEDGSLDAAFGSGGKVTTAFGPWRDRVFALALQADGKIVAGGDTDSGEYTGSAFGLARYHRDGSLDTSFGNAGKVRTDLPAGIGGALRSLGIQRDGTIVGVGTVGLEDDWGSVFELARYDAAGVLLGRSNSR